MIGKPVNQQELQLVKASRNPHALLDVNPLLAELKAIKSGECLVYDITDAPSYIILYSLVSRVRFLRVIVTQGRTYVYRD
jgi:hypothetical protein